MNRDVVLKNSTECGMAGTGISPIEEISVDGVTVGQKLSAARQGMRETDLEKISEELCIRPHLLRALEQDDFNKFPSACYAAGFLKNYAAYLELDVAQIVAQYKKDYTGSTKKVDLVFIEAERHDDHARQITISMVILTALVFYGVWYSLKGKDHMLLSSLPDVSDVASDILAKVSGDKAGSPEESDVYAEVTQPVTQPVTLAVRPESDKGFSLVQKVNASPVATGTTPRISAANQIRLSVKEDSWIRIVDRDRAVLVDRILLAGEQFSLTDSRKGLMLMTSNAGALSILVGDTALSSLGRRGEIRNNISLDQDNLLMHVAGLSR